MRAFTIIVFGVLWALWGCGAQVKPADEPPRRVENQEQEKKPASMPTIEYYPGT
ncbi:MAG TPA: hypothetical protein VNL14_09490 [Candidatus Acidoferrales bacterium]|nr:hypothetical protein [Candidatus Acidoferrales bacterium]